MDEVAWKEVIEAAAKDRKIPRPQRVADSPVFDKGLHDQPLDPVPRGPLGLFSAQLPSPAIGDGESGRLQLARWITDPRNPLTARVFVNRAWHHLFGTGLVESVDNFGLLGMAPSHPELLDDLALRFSGDEMGGSMKQLIRTLVLSRTWRLASTVNEAAHEKDPGVGLRWRFAPQRLEGEAVRDSLLFVGQGLADRPEEGSQVYTISMKQEKPLQREIGRRDYYYQDLDREVTYRSVYLPMARDVIFDSLKVFDAPDPNLVVGGRKLTTVPTQALYLMNSPVVLAQAVAMAERILAETGDDDDVRRIGKVYEILLGRPPTPEESGLVGEYLASSDGEPLETWAEIIQAVMGAAEFRTVY